MGIERWTVVERAVKSVIAQQFLPVVLFDACAAQIRTGKIIAAQFLPFEGHAIERDVAEVARGIEPGGHRQAGKACVFSVEHADYAAKQRFQRRYALGRGGAPLRRRAIIAGHHASPADEDAGGDGGWGPLFMCTACRSKKTSPFN